MVDLQPAGVGMIRARRVIVGLAVLTCAFAAAAQSEVQLAEGELTLDIDVRFISTYRDGSWVPVDIIVNNNDRDIDGYLEVTTIQAGVKQAPDYRVPVDSPKGSRKRFRLYCMLDGTTDLEAMLYRGRRPAISVPMKIALRPIDKNDYLCLILDKDPTGYAYLYDAVLDNASDQRFYRVDLSGEELASLPDRLRCYDPIDAIIMGAINPDDISRRHRALLQRYVENGGTLIVCGGANTGAYRGTWVEELAGVEFGSPRVVNERECAELALRAPTADRINEAKQGEITALMPAGDELYRWGGEMPLAAMRPLGRGVIAVVALDMDAKLLHTTSEYAHLWQQLVRMRANRPDINVETTSSYLRTQLPNVAGVRVFPRSSVAAYLTVYLLVAIVGNWVFWSFMKRREMAWVCLVFFSAAFTAYAMIYGTAGRAKETELEQVNIVRIYDHTPVAKVHSTIGLLSARSARYSFALADEAGLVSQGQFAYPAMGVGSPITEGSFAFMQATPPRVEDMRVGASVMRTVQVESDLSLNGGFEGTLVHDETGLHGTLVNNTGLTLADPYIYYKGKTVRAMRTPGTNTIEVKVSPDRLSAAPQVNANMNYVYYGYYWEKQSVQTAIRDPLAQLVFSSKDGFNAFDPSLGPFVFGWAADAPPPAIVLEEAANQKIKETFLVADVTVEGSGRHLMQLPLTVSVKGQPQRMWSSAYYQDWYSQSYNLSSDPGLRAKPARAEVEIDLPADVAARGEGDLIVELKWTSDGGGALHFQPAEAPEDWSKNHARVQAPERIEMLGMNVNVTRYRIPDWRSMYDESSQAIAGYVELRFANEQQRRQMMWSQYMLQASMEVRPGRTITEEWQPWQ